MSAKTDQLETDTARWINRTSESVVATRPKTSTAFSDVWISKDGFDPCWIEVKSDHADNILNPRVYYDGKWKTTYTQYSANVAVQLLNSERDAKEFIRNLAHFADIAVEQIKLPTNTQIKKLPGCVTVEELKEFFEIAPNKYIINVQGYDLGTMITRDYNERGAFYMQAADDFFCLGTDNPLKLPEDIPIIEGEGEFRVRVSSRSRGICEVQAEIKFDNLPSSQYSCMPGTDKLNPLQ